LASAQGALEQADSPIVVLEERAWVGGGQIAAGLCDIEKPEAASTLSERSSLVDSQAEMGHGTTGSSERVLASRGLLTSAELEFVAADDVPNGGVLCALPALLAEKLLSHTRTLYRLPPGFYPLESIFLALALYRRFVEFCEACAPATSILAARATSRAA
jgi:hypothetical protein